MANSIPRLAEQAYETYRLTLRETYERIDVLGRNYYNEPVPWQDLDNGVKEAWCAAAQEILWRAE